jgi:hypothetical protein
MSISIILKNLAYSYRERNFFYYWTIENYGYVYI